MCKTGDLIKASIHVRFQKSSRISGIRATQLCFLLFPISNASSGRSYQHSWMLHNDKNSLLATELKSASLFMTKFLVANYG